MFALVYALAADAHEHRLRVLAKYARYNRSEKGRAWHERYEGSVKGAFTLARKRLNESIRRHACRLHGLTRSDGTGSGVSTMTAPRPRPDFSRYFPHLPRPKRKSR